jgi:hypothetical protein
MKTKWRDILPVHPAADALPLLSPAELAELAADIKENGLREAPVVIYDGDVRVLLDGRNRLDALELAGLTFTGWQGGPRAMRLQYSGVWPDAGTELMPDGGFVECARGDGDPAAYVISANLRRRHLPPGELVRLALAIRAAGETRTDDRVSVGGRGVKGEASAVAAETGVPVRTVRRVIAAERPHPEPDPSIPRGRPVPRRDWHPAWWRDMGRWLKYARRDDLEALLVRVNAALALLPRDNGRAAVMDRAAFAAAKDVTPSDR